MCKQSEDDEDGALCVQAACCMQLCAQVVGDGILEHVMPKVAENITHNDWHLREAATYSFGAIMDGCSTNQVGKYANQSLPVLVKMVNEEKHDKTRETAAWTLSRVTEFHFSAIPADSLDFIVRAALVGLSDTQGGVCAQCCTILHKIGIQQDDADDNQETNALSKYFNHVLQQLTKTSGRPDHEEHNLRMTSHEALNVWIENCANDCLPTVMQLLPPILQRLSATLQLSVREQTELHPKLLSTINVCLSRLYSDDTKKRDNFALQFCDDVMRAALTVMASNNDAPVAEAECLLVIMAVITATGEGFLKYLQASYQYILKAVKKTDSPNVCKCAIAIMGDAASELGQHMLPYCDEIMNEFFSILRNPNQDTVGIKPTVFTAFGSFALSIGPAFEKYLSVVMTLMREAATVQLPDNIDEETLEYMTDLRSEIMASYPCILQGAQDNNRQQQLSPYVQGIFGVIATVVEVEDDEEITGHTIGLIGDIAAMYGAQIGNLIREHQVPINKCLQAAKEDEDEQTRNTALFAQENINRALNNNR